MFFLYNRVPRELILQKSISLKLEYVQCICGKRVRIYMKSYIFAQLQKTTQNGWWKRETAAATKKTLSSAEVYANSFVTYVEKRLQKKKSATRAAS